MLKHITQRRWITKPQEMCITNRMLFRYLVVTGEDPRSIDRNCGFGEDIVPS